jgi:hypothetical protein
MMKYILFWLLYEVIRKNVIDLWYYLIQKGQKK